MDKNQQKFYGLSLLSIWLQAISVVELLVLVVLTISR